MLIKDYFTKDEIIEVMENAKEYNDPDFESLFDAMFNSDYYIIGTYEASQALETYENDKKLDGYKTNLDGVFGAIELVKHYETNLFEQLPTPLDDPESVANMVEYIRGENLFGEALNNAGLDMDSEANKQNIHKFIAAAKEL